MKQISFAVFSFAGALALAGCNPFPNAKQQDPELAQGEADIRAGKYGKETQKFAKEMDELKSMSREEQRRRLKELGDMEQAR